MERISPVSVEFRRRKLERSATYTFTSLIVRSGRSPRFTPADCAAACGGSTSTEDTAAVSPAAAPRKSRRDEFRSNICQTVSNSQTLVNCSLHAYAKNESVREKLKRRHLEALCVHLFC